jgi:hypothetical protein
MLIQFYITILYSLLPDLGVGLETEPVRQRTVLLLGLAKLDLGDERLLRRLQLKGKKKVRLPFQSVTYPSIHNPSIALFSSHDTYHFDRRCMREKEELLVCKFTLLHITFFAEANDLGGGDIVLGPAIPGT